MNRQGQIWLAVSLVAGMACAPSAPRKPAGVPPEAFWTGTRKAGVFIVIGPQETIGWHLKAFDDRTGAVKADGVYTIRGLARAELVREDIKGFDGNNFQLTDGGLLVPKAKP